MYGGILVCVANQTRRKANNRICLMGITNNNLYNETFDINAAEAVNYFKSQIEMVQNQKVLNTSRY